jgi:hypothetical protein
LAEGGDLYLANLVARKRRGDLVNTRGDKEKAKFYAYQPTTALWKEVYNSYMVSNEVPRIFPIIEK